MSESNDVNGSIATLVADRILGVCPFSKKIFIKGSFPDKDGIAIAILERDPISIDDLPGIFEESLSPKVLFKNDIYLSLKHFPKPELSSVKTTLIYPATEQLVEKYTLHPNRIVEETPKLFEDVTSQYIIQNSKSCEWVYNILDHKAECERIIYEDSDPEIGYILLPDLKWDGTNTDAFYLQALPHRRGIKCLRDLTAKDLPLLRNINQTAKVVISEKYNIDKSRILVYLHYLPSFFHLHVHFHLIDSGRPFGVERCHLLTTVIQNIEFCSNYYQKATLPISLKSSDELLVLLQNGSENTNGDTPTAVIV